MCRQRSQKGFKMTFPRDLGVAVWWLKCYLRVDFIVSVKHGAFPTVLYVIFSESIFICLHRNMEPFSKTLYIVLKYCWTFAIPIENSNVNVTVDSNIIFLAFQNLLLSSKEWKVLSLLSLGTEDWQEIRVWETKSVCYSNRSSNSLVSAHAGPGGEVGCQASQEWGRFQCCWSFPHWDCLQVPSSSDLRWTAVPSSLPPSRGEVPSLSLPDTVGPGSDFHKAGLMNPVCHTQGIVIGHCALAAERTRLVEGSG